MSEVDLSPEALIHRRNIAENATPGPWRLPRDGENTDIVRTGWHILAYQKKTNPVVAITRDSQRRMRTSVLHRPQWMFNRDHITINDPASVIAMIDEIDDLRKGNECAGMFSTFLSRSDLALRRKVAEKSTWKNWKSDENGFIFAIDSNSEQNVITDRVGWIFNIGNQLNLDFSNRVRIIEVVGRNDWRNKVKHIAFNHPDAIIAMIDEIQRLREIL